jgi:hypothetical protein
MTSYNNFDSEIYSEECFPVNESEHDEVMQMLADEHEASEGFADWSAEDQRLWEAEQARLKNWTKKYSPNVDGDSYAGISV